MSLIVSIISGIRVFGNSLLPNSSESAQEVLKRNSDPMSELNLHFKKLLKRINRPVVIFVDDLDRCKYDYTENF